MIFVIGKVFIEFLVLINIIGSEETLCNQVTCIIIKSKKIYCGRCSWIAGTMANTYFSYLAILNINRDPFSPKLVGTIISIVGIPYNIPRTIKSNDSFEVAGRITGIGCST